MNKEKDQKEIGIPEAAKILRIANTTLHRRIINNISPLPYRTDNTFPHRKRYFFLEKDILEHARKMGINV